MKVVIDTNVLISALLFGGLPARLAAGWRTGAISPLVSTAIMNEYLRVLAYPKFRLTNKEITLLLTAEVLPWFKVIATPDGPPFVPDDPADDKFIWCALAGKAVWIISGDEHLLACAASPVPVVTPQAFLADHPE
ncbi:MAG: putative toxin-antitoxin system toxin component, PIN family [Desulfobacteraceae bacterium]|nr:putative toxin-antitoxin system toxin component, PIN family [Desulfobacteraceae bacterium]